MITENKDKWKDIFHEKLIFSKLTNDHVLRLLTLQKIRKHNNIESKLIIYLDNLDLDEFELHPKLFRILNNCESMYNIKIQNASEFIDESQVKEYNKKVDDYNERDKNYDQEKALESSKSSKSSKVVNEQVEISI